MIKIIYACSGNGKIEIKDPAVKIYTNDKYVKTDIQKDCQQINYDEFDMIIASPPCNYWSKANYRRDREESKYAQKTKYLLQFFLNIATNNNKPIIIENVINRKLMEKELKIPNNIEIVINGRHTYFSNKNIQFIKKFTFEKSCNIVNKSTKQRQGDNQVQQVFEKFIKIYGLKQEETNIQLNFLVNS